MLEEGAVLTYFLDGKTDLRNVANASSLVTPGSSLHIANLTSLKEMKADSASIDYSLENSEQLEHLKRERLSAKNEPDESSVKDLSLNIDAPNDSDRLLKDVADLNRRSQTLLNGIQELTSANQSGAD